MTNRPALPPCLRETSHDGGGTIEVRDFRCKFGPEPCSAIMCGALSAFSSFVARRNASEMMDGVGRHEASRDGERAQAQRPWWLLLNPVLRHSALCGPCRQAVSSDGSKRLQRAAAPRRVSWRIDEYEMVLYEPLTKLALRITIHWTGNNCKRNTNSSRESPSIPGGYSSRTL